MSVNLFNFGGRVYLTAKMFYALVRPRLYAKVIGNTIGRARGLAIPSSAILGLTYKCQCQCVHCSAGLYKRDVSDELSTGEWLRLLDDIQGLGVPRVNLSGGEALLREDIFDIVAHAARYFVVILESNGLKLSLSAARRLKKAGVSCVAVSIDSTAPKEHDRLRHSDGCFQHAMEGVANLHEAGVPCIMSTYIPAERARASYVQGLNKLARMSHVMALRILPPRPVGSFSCHVSSLLTENDEKLILKEADPFMAYFNGMPAPKMCGIFSRATFYVSPHGDVQPCPFMPIAFGKVRAEGLKVLLEKMWSHPVFKNEGKKCLVLQESFRNKYLNGRNGYPLDAASLI
ncbi:MAG: radical SAM protein [Candidatus Omnitrophica bacterium]|nr:radical SAM protein [Candidatus Omnitrophota bacterium]